MKTEDILKKAASGDLLSKQEFVHLLDLRPDSRESFRVMAEAGRLSKEIASGKSEIHAQFALNLDLCNCECLFCSFARTNAVFGQKMELTPDQAALCARQLESDGANAVYVMTTAQYPFEKFLEMSQEIRKSLRPETTLIANVGDQTAKNAARMKDCGFAGVYHAVRLREGIDTGLPIEKRKQSIRNFLEAGLEVGTCVEPVGPEHTSEELAEMIEFTASFQPAYSGAARRISIPGTPMARRGMISELRMAQIVAVTRLGMPRSVMGHCTHEPCTLGAVGGANLFWAEMGANPRDVRAKTEEGRGETVESCRKIFRETHWEVRQGPSRYFNPGRS